MREAGLGKFGRIQLVFAKVTKVSLKLKKYFKRVNNELGGGQFLKIKFPVWGPLDGLRPSYETY